MEVKLEPFAKIVNGQQPLAIFTKHSIFDVWLSSEYAAAVNDSRNGSDHNFYSQVCLRPYQTSTMELFAKIGNSFLFLQNVPS